MTRDQLFSKLKQAGIRLWVDPKSDQLKFEAPKGALTDNLRTEIKAQKDDLVTFLQKVQQDNRTVEKPLRPMGRSGAIPLSFAQQRLWFLYNLEGKNATYNIPACRHLYGPLNRGALQQALDALVARHEILRTNFATRNEQAVQVITSDRTIPILFKDIRDLPDQEKQSILTQHIKAETGYAFDLESDRLLRLSLLQKADNHHVLTLVLHHIIGDGWSLEILIRELRTLYDAFLARSDADLPPLVVQYGDFALWQHEWVENGGLDRQLAFWKNTLDGVPPLLELPYDHPRPARQSYHGAIVETVLPPSLKQRLENFCKEESASLYMGLCSVLTCLIHKYMGLEDIVIGTHTAGRTRQEQEALIGFFINTLPLRCDLSGKPNFRDVLKRTAQSARDVFSNQDVPFEKLVDLVQPERDMSYAPLVQVMCVLQNMPISNDSFQGIEVAPLPLARDTSKFDLSLLVEVQHDDSLHCEFEYNSDLFDNSTIKRIADQFSLLLSRLLETPDTPVGDIGLLDKAALAKLTQKTAQAADQTPRPHDDIVTFFEQQVSTHPDRIALVEQDTALTYAALNHRANQLAHYLKQQGLARENVVALYLENSIGAITALLAVLKAGGCYLPLDIHHPASRRDFILTDSSARFVLCEHIPDHTDTTAQWITLKDIPHCCESNLEDKPTPDQLAYIIYTSGSTGTPKGVMIEHHSVLDLMNGLSRYIYDSLPPSLNVALLANLAFDASVQQVFGALLQGHSLHLCPQDTKRDAQQLLDFLHDHHIQLCDATPTLLDIMTQAGLPARGDLNLRHVLVGGEALPQRAIIPYIETEITLTNIYGPTECCVDSLAFTITSQADLENRTSTVPIGQPLGDCMAYILDDAGHPVPPGIDGELCLSGSGLFRGYVNQAQLTNNVRCPNPFASPRNNTGYGFLYRTGDICHQRTDGSIVFVRRKDDQVKIRGYRIELGEIENQLQTHPDLTHAAVIARKSSLGTQEICAFIQTEHNPDIADLHSYLKDRLPDYMIPAHFFQMEHIPLNASGKTDRKALAVHGEDQGNRLNEQTHFLPPQTQEQQLLCEVIGSVLGRDKISIRDNFFYLGGDSIKALQVVARIHQKGYLLEVRNLFEHPTIQDLARDLKAIQTAHHQAVPLCVGDRVPLSAIQHWFFENYPDPSLHFNQSVLLHARQRLDETCLKQALEDILYHHDAFRLKYRHQDGKYIQYVDHPTFGFSIAESDETDLPALSEQAQKSVDLHDTTLQAVLLRHGDQDRLFITAHHLIVDAVSWRTVLAELEQAYHARQQNKQPDLPTPPVSFAQWAQGVEDFANQGVLDQLPYWQGIDKKSRLSLPRDVNASSCTHADCDILSTQLDKEMTNQLLGNAHQTYNSRIDDFLLCALARSLACLNPEYPQAVMLESHGREALPNGLSVGNNVGWLTSLYPVLLEKGDKDPGHHLKQMKETLRAVPQKGIGYGILRYLSTPPTHHNIDLKARPEISFNYLGQLDDFDQTDGLFVFASDDTAPNIAPDAPQPFIIEVIAFASQGHLHIKFGYSTRHYQRDTIATLIARYQGELKGLIQHALNQPYRELTPSDIDYDGFTQAELDHFLNALQSHDAPTLTPEVTS